jgi:hypothetical protein
LKLPLCLLLLLLWPLLLSTSEDLHQNNTAQNAQSNSVKNERSLQPY